MVRAFLDHFAATYPERGNREAVRSARGEVFPFVVSVDGRRLGEATLVDHEPHVVTLEWLAAYEPRKGDGRRILSLICAKADEYGVMLTLSAEPQDQAITRARLRAFYATSGFAPGRLPGADPRAPSAMHRVPRR